jgi:hypothetical protein
MSDLSSRVQAVLNSLQAERDELLNKNSALRTELAAALSVDQTAAAELAGLRAELAAASVEISALTALAAADVVEDTNLNELLMTYEPKAPEPVEPVFLQEETVEEDSVSYYESGSEGE